MRNRRVGYSKKQVKLMLAAKTMGTVVHFQKVQNDEGCMGFDSATFLLRAKHIQLHIRVD